MDCRLTQRWEASLWLSGKQLYLGGFEREEDAARAYDIAALACKGPMVATNFDSSEYTEELDAVRGCSKVCLPRCIFKQDGPMLSTNCD